MSQGVFSRASVLDFYGQPVPPANPPANTGRLYYNAVTNSLTSIDANGYPLIVSPNSLSPLGGITFPNLTPTQIYAAGLAIGDHSLYTVPAGKKAFVQVSVGNNSGVGNIVVTPKVSLDGGSTFIITNGAFTVANQAAGFEGWEYMFSAGEVVALNTATNNGANVFGTVYLFDNAATIKCVKLTSFITGNNTLYTCPSGKTAYLIYGYGVLISGNANAPSINIATSGAATIKINIVQNGGSVGATNQLFSASVNGINGPAAFITLNPGDFININSSAGASTLLAWITVVEF